MKFGLFVLLTIIVTPIIINGLMFIELFPVAGDKFIWIDSLSTLWGAIIGGLVSGSLTLIGVKLSIDASFNGIQQTINHQANETFKQTVGKKLNKLYSVKKIIYRADRLLHNRSYGWNEKHEKEDLKEIDKEILYFLLPELNHLLELSSVVDWEFFDEIKQFVDKARECMLNGSKESMEELAKVTDRLTETIEFVHEKRLSNEFKKASNN